MRRYQSFLALVLAAIATFLVSCSSSPDIAKGPTYTQAQLEELQGYADDISEFRDRMPEIAKFVQLRKWGDVASFIHGPLGELRPKMSQVARRLEPNAQKQANNLSQEVFEHLILIDEAANASDSTKALSNYRGAIEDLNSFLNLIPRPSPVDESTEAA